LFIENQENLASYKV